MINGRVVQSRIDYTHLEELRQKTWSAITPIDHKLWGTANELRKTVQFINASGQRI